MPKRIPDTELEAIVSALARHPDGISTPILREALPFSLPPRMLQRRLAWLVGQSRLVAEGHGKGRRYRLPPGNVDIFQSAPARLGMQTLPALVELNPALSEKAEAIKHAVRAPLQARTPIGYCQAFLYDYRPNQTFYLPAETRERLSRMGRAPVVSLDVV